MSCRALKKLGDQQYEAGDYAAAAESYQKAWELKPKAKNKDLIFKAAESYYTINDYRNASEAYQHVKDDNEAYPLVGLKYARSLKQDGQYDAASTAFQAFMDDYNGEGRPILEEIIRREIQGCELGKTLPAQANRNLELKLISPSVNSDANEFAPFLSLDNKLYLSSDRGGRARIYASDLINQVYSSAIIPNDFPLINTGQYANAAFAPDGSRMYFTICADDTSFDALNTRCELFYSARTTAGWSVPQRLPDYINMDGVTTTHPYVAHANGLEYVFFASNRSGSRGGMDLWYTTRDLGIDNNDFTVAVNLGPTVNTLGDEITPCYSPEEQQLYFASNGHPTIGGFDVFSSIGAETSWSMPENAGLPVNSSADDFGYMLSANGSQGFLVSNRVFAGEKLSTTDTDIFGFGSGRRLVLEGNVYEKLSGEPLSEVMVSLYQIFDDNTENLLINKAFQNGRYMFELLPDRTFRVEVGSSGYDNTSYTFNTNDPNVNQFGQPLFLDKTATVVPPTYPPTTTTTPPTTTYPPTTTTTPDRVIINTTPESTPYVARGTSPGDKLEYTSTAPRHSGTYYRIQLAAVGRYTSGDSRYSAANAYGSIYTEKLTGRNLTRILVGDYFSRGEADRNLSTLKANGFSTAYIVQYNDGTRYGKVR